jgi:hypothetical protein
MLPNWFAIVVPLLVCGAALWKGGPDEKAAGAMFLMSLVITRTLRDHSWPLLQRGDLLADTLFFVGLLVLALRTPRYWPLAAAAFQFLSVLTHMGKLIDPNVHQWAYITAQVIWSYLVLAAIGVGTWTTWSAQRASAG